jgi:hypothetical protein
MRLGMLLAMVVLSSCLASQTKAGANTVGKTTEPRKVELVEGRSVDLGSGVSVTLKSVMYTHATDKTGRSVNDSFMQLEVTHDGKTENVTITRLFPDAPRFTTVAGLEMAIDYVDAYHVPSTGALLVK